MKLPLISKLFSFIFIQCKEFQCQANENLLSCHLHIDSFPALTITYCCQIALFFVLFTCLLCTILSPFSQSELKEALNILNDNWNRTIFNVLYCQGVHKCYCTLNFLWRPADYIQKLWYMGTTWNVLIFLDKFFFSDPFCCVITWYPSNFFPFF